MTLLTLRTCYDGPPVRQLLQSSAPPDQHFCVCTNKTVPIGRHCTKCRRAKQLLRSPLICQSVGWSTILVQTEISVWWTASIIIISLFCHYVIICDIHGDRRIDDFPPSGWLFWSLLTLTDCWMDSLEIWFRHLLPLQEELKSLQWTSHHGHCQWWNVTKQIY